MIKYRRTIILAAVLMALAAGLLNATDFNIGGPKAADSVFFRSTAKLEFIEGKTSSISGSITCDPDDMSHPISGVIQVDLRTIKTGIDLRDQHMRERHLNTDKFPFAYYEIDSVTGFPVTPSSGIDYPVEVYGHFYIRGVKRQLRADGVVSFGGAEAQPHISVSSNFQVNLDDYQIPRPRALFMKLAETIEVELRFVAHRSDTTAVPQLPDWTQVD